jgi:protein arginine N-methyltransferase 2
MDLIEACSAGNLELIESLLSSEGANVYYERESDGWTCLTAAAANGHEEIVARLIDEAAPWNAVDKVGMTAAQYAKLNGYERIYEFLLNHAIRTELIMSVLDRKEDREEEEDDASNRDYLNSKLEYKDGKLLDSTGDAVMMAWETPLMIKHAELLNVTGKSVLNIGFGLGIIDTELQKLQPAKHTIVEAHPDVYKHMIDQGWDKKPGVRIVFGRWQDVLHELEPCGYDAVYFDTYGEFYDDMREFHEALLDLLTPETGVYSFFNGLAAKNEFFHEVYCNIAELELQALGLQTEWHKIPMIPEKSNWEGVRRTYWTLNEYNLPMCRFV